MAGYYYIENYMMGDVFFSATTCPLKLKNIERIDFASTIEDYGDEYNFRADLKRNANYKGKKQVQLEKKIKVTDVYDSKGYQHRYVVQEFLKDVLAGLENFDDKSN